MNINNNIDNALVPIEDLIDRFPDDLELHQSILKGVRKLVSKAKVSVMTRRIDNLDEDAIVAELEAYFPDSEWGVENSQTSLRFSSGDVEILYEPDTEEWILFKSDEYNSITYHLSKPSLSELISTYKLEITDQDNSEEVLVESL